jgi:hypothetical protein
VELLIVIGIVALVGLVALGAYVVLDHRRSGTVKAVLAPRRSLSRAAREAEEDAGTDATAT